MNTATALSLHIGLNRISKEHYGAEYRLGGCENDAAAMHHIAVSMGFEPTTLLNELATADAILNAIRSGARNLAPGGIFLLTYAGHGSQVSDLDGDELGESGAGDKFDETWCVYDRMLVDDELARAWADFPPGARILFFSDSCHSGTMSRFLESRALPPEAANFAVTNHFEAYSHLVTVRDVTPETRATVILISGCQDNQTSSDGTGGNGLFTENLLDVWDNCGFRGSYPDFHAAIARKMQDTRQTPNYTVIGAANHAFELQRPFTIETPNKGEEDMNGTADLSPRVAKLINGSRDIIGPSDSREVHGSCDIGISFDRQILTGLPDEKLLKFFQDEVAPRMLDNWITLNAAVVPTRSGDFSCTASTGGGGTVSCTGTIHF